MSTVRLHDVDVSSKPLRVDARALCKALGIEVREQGDALRGLCPNPHHKQQRLPGSWLMLADGPKAGFYNCHAECLFGRERFQGGPVSLVAQLRGCSYFEARRWIEAGDMAIAIERIERSEKTKPSRSAPPTTLTYPSGAYQLWHPSLPPHLERARTYAESRGLTIERMRHYRVHALAADAGRNCDCPERRHELSCPAVYRGRLIVPIVVNRTMVDFVARLYVDKHERPQSTKVLSGFEANGARMKEALWGYDDLDPAEPTVHIVEGVWGALAMLDAGLTNVVAACGSNWSPQRTALLSRWSRFVLVPDGDAGGSRFPDRCLPLREFGELLVADLGDGKQPDSLEPDALRKVVRKAVSKRRIDPGFVVVGVTCRKR